MDKTVNIYKKKIIYTAIQLAHKDNVNIYYSYESLTKSLNKRLEVTGDDKRDLKTCADIIKEMIRDLNSEYM